MRSSKRGKRFRNASSPEARLPADSVKNQDTSANIVKEDSTNFQVSPVGAQGRERALVEHDVPDIQYEPLQENQIRLLSLLPEPKPLKQADATRTGHLRGTFIRVTLTEDRRAFDENGEEISFDALSYTWEPTEPAGLLFVENCRLKIGANLNAALSRMREKEDAVYLWVDGICIDQNNIDEKEWQVSIMGKIFSSAAKVRIWVGEEDENSRLGVNLLRELMRYDAVTEANGFINNAHALLQKESTRNSIVGLFSLLTKKYWSRVWVVQEILLARQLQLYCGSQELDARSLFALLTVAKNTGMELLSSPPSTLPKHFFFSSIFRATRVLEQALGTPWHERMKNKVFPNLLEALVQMRGSDSTLEADKVFALLGIANGYEDFIRPNYRQTIRKIYQKTVQLSLSTQKSLDILTACRMFRYPYSRPDTDVRNVRNVRQTADRETILIILRLRQQNYNIKPLDLLKTIDYSSLNIAPKELMSDVELKCKIWPSDSSSLLPARKVEHTDYVAISWPQKDFDSLRSTVEACPNLQAELDHCRDPWPSWIPDWSDKRSNFFSTFGNALLFGEKPATWYAAAGTSEVKGLTNDKDLTLTLQGYLVDVIEPDLLLKATEPSKLSRDNALRGPDYLRAITWPYFQALANRQTAYSDQQHLAQAIIRASALGKDREGAQIDSESTKFQARYLLGDEDLLLHQMLFTAYPELEHLEGSLGEAHEEATSEIGFEPNLTAYMYGLGYFFTQTGYVGRAAIFDEGDLVCVLLGGKVPFLLREHKNTGRHFLVGECYVEGIMSGEILADGKHELREFVLI